jgi:hypothetical protein
VSDSAGGDERLSRIAVTGVVDLARLRRLHLHTHRRRSRRPGDSLPPGEWEVRGHARVRLAFTPARVPRAWYRAGYVSRSSPEPPKPAHANLGSLRASERSRVAVMQGEARATAVASARPVAIIPCRGVVHARHSLSPRALTQRSVRQRKATSPRAQGVTKDPPKSEESLVAVLGPPHCSHSSGISPWPWRQSSTRASSNHGSP